MASRRMPSGRAVGGAVVASLLAASFGSALAQGAEAQDPATIAWLLVSTAFVFFMVIGLAFFYGGLVRRKNALNTMMMSFVALGVVSLTWAAIGYSFAYSEGTAFIGGFGHALLRGVGLEGEGIPVILDFAFQGTFAVITAALISGAIVERMRFGAYMLFIALWSVLVYAPMAKWVWGGGFFENLLGASAIDFAGGTVVHINAAVTALVLALLIGKRKDFGSKAMLPHQVPFTLLGAGILWFGWFGFNGGSAYAADGIAALAMTNTLLAPAATIVVWALVELTRIGRITAVGLATAIVVGLVAVTPAAGVISPASAIVIGAIAALPCYAVIAWRTRAGLDDSLDVFGAHGVGGITGALLTGLFVSTAWGGDVNGSFGQFLTQIVAVLIAAAYSAVGAFVLAKLVGAITPLRAEQGAEEQGLDVPLHGEEAYTDGEGALLIPVRGSKRAAQVVSAVPGPGKV